VPSSVDREVHHNRKTIPGHWDDDLIMGKHQRTALDTLVERTTSYNLRYNFETKIEIADSHCITVVGSR